MTAVVGGTAVLGAAGWALAEGLGAPGAPAAGTTSVATAAFDSGGAGHPGDHVRGTVTAENGSTWTVTTAKGRAVTVTLTPQTAFGTTKSPATVAQFPVGSEVRVLGTRQGDGAGGQGGRSLTATRIVAPRSHAAPGTPATPAPGTS